MNPVIDTPQGRCVPEKTRQSLRNKERKMEKMSVRRSPEDYGFDRESWKNVQMRFYESELNDPELRDLYLDCVEVHVETLWAVGRTEILGREFFTRWSVEMKFLQWLNLYLSRGMDFEEAWFPAVEALSTTEEGRGIAYEDLDELGEEVWEEYEQSLEWYLDDDIYRPRVEAWTEQLVDFGMSQDKAEDMAEELIRLLREISFEQRIRPADFWVMGGVAGSQACFESVKSSVGPSRRNVSANAGRSW